MAETGTARVAQGAIHSGGAKPVPDPLGLLKELGENAAVFVQRPGADTAGRHTGILIGNIRNQQLVIGVYDGVEFKVGEHLILRMSRGPHLVGFDTHVLKKLDDPPLYFVQFPIKIEAINLRKAQRIQAFFPADVRVNRPGSDQVLLLTARVLDISAGGCSFRSKSKLPAAEVNMSFALPGDRHIQSVRGSLVESVPAGLVFHSRVKFSQEPSNIPAMQEVAKWVAEGLSFGAE